MIELTELGLSPHFQSQLKPNDQDGLGRVGEVHRDRIVVRMQNEDLMLEVDTKSSTSEIAVGDWVTFDLARKVVRTVLDRRTSLVRTAAGSTFDEQIIAANVDTLFIVTSCNADFNIARLERYLTLAASSELKPVMVLTKADLTDDADRFRRDAEGLSPIATVVTVNALDTGSVSQLSAWLREGETGALVGSSGVGKSTILNALTGASASTQGIREDDAKGRHTTTSRSLKRAMSGGWLIDTPGIRQLAVVNSAYAIDQVFSDISGLFEGCRFSDCSHEAEPGCAVQSAVENGTLDPERLRRWRKLRQEDRNSLESAEEDRRRQKGSSKKKKASLGRRRGPKR